jgi:diaminopimelate decarboxylase
MDVQRYAIGLHGFVAASSVRHEPVPIRPCCALCARTHGTPLWVYDAATIRERIAELRGFDTIRYAQKANSNIHLLRLMRAQGVVVDAVSLGEIERALAAGYTTRGEGTGPGHRLHRRPDRPTTLATVVAEGIPVNAGSIDMLRQLGLRQPGHPVWLRINPGFGHGHSNKTNTGGEHSKHGIWHADLPARWPPIASTGLRLVGLHMHIGSGVDYGHLQQVCGAMVTWWRGWTRHADLQALGRRRPVDSLPRRRAAHRHRALLRLWDAARRASPQRLGHAGASGDRTRALSGGRGRRAAGRGARHQAPWAATASRWWTPASTT